MSNSIILSWNRIFLFESCEIILCKRLVVCLCKLIFRRQNGNCLVMTHTFFFISVTFCIIMLYTSITRHLSFIESDYLIPSPNFHPT